ncbi:hypothetical protein A2U01_0058577, partial [Trifolium medium]|nr:hypothetical protein [Trifolium medium]
MMSTMRSNYRLLQENLIGLAKAVESSSQLGTKGYAHVLKRAVAYASGLPLALEVI